MDFGLTEEQRELAGLAERVFSEQATVTRVSAAEASADRCDHALWGSLAAAGLLGLAVPEEYGGAGLGLLELCLLLEQQGRRVAPVPAYATLLLGALPITELGTPEQRARWLPAVAAGEVFLTAALADQPGCGLLAPTTVATRAGEGWRLSGRRPSVPAAHLAARIVVPASVEVEGVALFLVDPAADGVTLERAETTDRSLQPHLALDGAPGELLAAPDPGARALRRLVERATVGLCALQVGVAEEAVRMVAAHTSQRQQFGRPLATFQGVALRAADAYIDTEAMRVTLWQAAWRLAEGLAASREVAVAKWWAAEGGHRVVHAAQHLHGGLGADVDFPVHRYFLWGKQLEVMLGGAGEQLALLGRQVMAAG